MIAGAVVQRARQTFRHGLSTAYYRDFVRPRILRSSPIPATVDTACEIHVLTSAQDWINLVWTLKSFYAVSPRGYALCIHEDGTLNDVAIDALREHFPNSRLVRRKEADAKMEGVLANYPRCHDFRRANLLAPKIFDFMAFLEGGCLALFDSDLLFFNRPNAYLALLEKDAPVANAFNEDIASAYAVEEEAIRDAGHDIMPNVNSGLGVVRRGSMPLDWIEEFLSIPGLVDGHFWRIEQTLFALCATRYGVTLLPPEYRVYIGRGVGDRPMRHYVGAVRHLMYSEGMRLLAPRLLA